MVSSTPSWQQSQVAFLVTCRRNRFFFVGSDSLLALHRKCFILLGMSRSHKSFQKVPSEDRFDDPGFVLCSASVSNLYAFLVV